MKVITFLRILTVLLAGVAAYITYDSNINVGWWLLWLALMAVGPFLPRKLLRPALPFLLGAAYGAMVLMNARNPRPVAYVGAIGLAALAVAAHLAMREHNDKLIREIDAETEEAIR